MPSPVESAEPQIGSQLGRYRIVARLGSGGMGDVFAAEDPSLGRKVAIKILPGATAGDADRRARFEREARAIAALSHPNIVTVHAVEEAGGRHFLVMELIAGRTLGELIPKDGMAAARLLELGIPLADAVAAAHAQGITHRDLKPQNVMVDEDGRLKVLDFGLAKVGPQEGVNALDETAAAETGEGRILGTVAYMSPEQAQGRKVDSRSDIFSLGVVLFEMATGRRPFSGDNNVSLIAAILRDSPQSVTDLNRGLPAGLARIVRRCLAKEPGRRYQAAADLRSDLEDLRDEGRSGVAAASPARRRSGAALPLGLAALALFAAALLVRQLRRDPPPEPAPAAASPARGPTFARVTQITSDPGSERSPSLSPDGKIVVYAGRTSAGWDLFQQRVGGERTINLTSDTREDDVQPAFSADGERIAFRSERGGGGIFVMGATGESVRRVSDFGYQPSWSPDGSELAVSTQSLDNPADTGTAGGELWVIRTTTGEKRKVASALALQPAWSPHGTRIAFWGRQRKGVERNLFTVPAAGGPVVPLTDDPSLHWTPAWSPDGRWLYYSSDQRGETNLLRLPVDEQSGAALGPPEMVTVGGGIESHSPSLSRAGDRLLYAAGSHENALSKLRYDPIKEITIGSPIPLAVGANPRVHGDWIAYELYTPAGLHLIKGDGTGRRRLTEESPGGYRHATWAPDGSEIAFSSSRTGRREVWAIHPDGSGLRQVTDLTPGHSLVFPLWGANKNEMLATLDFEKHAQVILFDPTRPFAGQTTSHFPDPPGGVALAATDRSPDGRQVALVRFEGGTLRGIWVFNRDLGTYREVAPEGNSPTFLPDGKRLIFELRGKLLLADIKGGRSRPLVSLSEGFADNCQAIDGEYIYFDHIVERADLWLAQLE